MEYQKQKEEKLVVDAYQADRVRLDDDAYPPWVWPGLE